MSTKKLLVLRHSKASKDAKYEDHERPLTERGLSDAEAAGNALSGSAIDVVLCSTSTRTRQTWEHAKVGGASSSDVRFEADIYSEGRARLLELVRALPEHTHSVLLIGHEPTLSELIVSLAEPSPIADDIDEKFPTSSIARLEFEGPWSGLAKHSARLTSFETPRG